MFTLVMWKFRVLKMEVEARDGEGRTMPTAGPLYVVHSTFAIAAKYERRELTQILMTEHPDRQILNVTAEGGE